MGFKRSGYRTNDKPKKESVLARIEKFIDVEPTGDGNGFAPVTTEEMDELYEIIRDIVSMRWRADADGDLPIRPPELIDWKRFEAPQWLPILQHRFGENARELEFERLTAVISNLSTAVRAVESEIRTKALNHEVLDELGATLSEKPLEAAVLRARLVSIENELKRKDLELESEKERAQGLIEKNRDLRKLLPKVAR